MIKEAAETVIGVLMARLGIVKAAPASGAAINDTARDAVRRVIGWLQAEILPQAPSPYVLDDVLYHADAKVATWVQEKFGQPLLMVPFVALGVVSDGAEANLLAGAYYTSEREGADILISVFSDSKAAAKPEAISRVFDYAFGQRGLPRITAEIAATNHDMIRIAEKLGFVQEGIKRRAAGNGVDMLIYGLLREEAKRAGTWAPMPVATKVAA